MLTNVNADESVAWLSSLVTADNKRHTDEALTAIAMHETAKATAALEDFASSANPLWLREKAAFWLGAGRGHDGFLALQKLANDPDPEFRKKLSFDLFVSHDPAAVDDLILMAKSDKDVGVREQAIFWVGQKAGAKAVAMLKDTVENDPEVGVKKKAVFALSQLPKDDAVPELIHVAQTNSEPIRTQGRDLLAWTDSRSASSRVLRAGTRTLISARLRWLLITGSHPVGLHVVSGKPSLHASHEGARAKFSCSRPLERARLQTTDRADRNIGISADIKSGSTYLFLK